MIFIKEDYSKTPIYLLSISLLVFFFFFLRIGSDNFINNSLWAEDGSIFIAQAAGLGFKSLWEPYASYLHVYPRMFALVAQYFGISNAPKIYFFGWTVSFLLMIFVVSKALYEANVKPLLIMVSLILILFQPHSGETYFNLTNSQWFLAISSSIIVILNYPKKLNFFSGSLFAILCLTGPFSLILLPIALLKLYMFKDFRERFAIYLILAVGAITQFVFIFTSDRLKSGSVDLNALHWLESIWIFFTFGGNSNVLIFLSVIVWFVFVCLLVDNVRRLKRSTDIKYIFLLLAASGLFFFAGLFSVKDAPLSLNPVGGGARYYIIPYSLIFITLAFIRKFYISWIMIFCLMLICIIQFRQVNRSEIHYQAYVSFSVEKDISIPINPQWPAYPGWSIDTKMSNHLSQKAVAPVLYNLSQTLMENANITKRNIELNFISLNNHPQLYLEQKIECPGSEYVGLEIMLERDFPGWVKLFYSADQRFSETKTLKRFYPKGRVQVHFSYENIVGGSYLRIDPMNQVGEGKFISINYYCLL